MWGVFANDLTLRAKSLAWQRGGGCSDRSAAEDVARHVSRTGCHLDRFTKRVKRVKRAPASLAGAPLSANSPPGGQGVFIGVLYPVRQNDRNAGTDLARAHRRVAA